MRRRTLLHWLFVSLCLWTQVASATDSPAGIPAGRGSFVFTDAKGDPAKPIKVYTYLPTGVDPVAPRTRTVACRDRPPRC